MKTGLTKGMHQWRALSEARFNRKALTFARDEKRQENQAHKISHFNPNETTNPVNPQMNNVLTLEGKWSGIKQLQLEKTCQGKLSVAPNLGSEGLALKGRYPANNTSKQFNPVMKIDQQLRKCSTQHFPGHVSIKCQ